MMRIHDDVHHTCEGDSDALSHALSRCLSCYAANVAAPSTELVLSLVCGLGSI